MKKNIETSLETAREMYKDSTRATKLRLLDNFTVEELEGYIVGKWYIAECRGIENYLIKYKKQDGDDIIASLFITDGGSFVPAEGSFTSIQRAATADEILNALKKEAENRGFKEGVLARTTDGKSTYKMRGEWKYEADCDGLTDAALWIYENGRWADIVKEETNSADEVRNHIISNYEIPTFYYDSNIYRVMKIAHNLALDRAAEKVYAKFVSDVPFTDETLKSAINEIKSLRVK